MKLACVKTASCGGKSGNSWLHCTRGELFLLAMAVLAAGLLREMTHVRLFPDSVDYLTFARNIISGIHHNGDISLARYRRAPLYPHLVALFSIGGAAAPYLVEVGRQVSILAGTFMIFPVYLLARRLVEPVGGVAAVLFVVFLPEYIYYSSAVLTESVAALLVVCSLLLLWQITEKDLDDNEFSLGKSSCFLLLLQGSLLGLAFLARHASIGFLGLALTWLVVVRARVFLLKRNWHAVKMTGTAVVLVVAGFFIVVIPQVLFLHSETGRWALAIDPSSVSSLSLETAGGEIRNTKNYELVDSLTPDAEYFVWEKQGSNGIFSFMLDNPGRYAHAFMSTILRGYLPDTYPLPYPKILLFLVALGICGWFWERKFAEFIFCLWGFGGYYLFMGLFLNLRDRHMFSAYVFLLFAAGSGAATLCRIISRCLTERLYLGKKRVVVAGVWLVVVAFLLPSGLRFIREQNRMASTEFFEKIGMDINAKIEGNSRMFSRTAHIPFFAGANFAALPYGEIEDIVRFGRSRGVGYLVISSDDVSVRRPQLEPLLRFREPHFGLQPIAVYGNDRKWLLVLYRILPG